MTTICLGGANLDIIGTSRALFTPGDSNPGIIKYGPGGVARNIAENLQRLGVQTHLLSVVGNDIGRDIILRNCAEVGINTDFLVTIDNARTGTYMAVNNPIGGLLAAISDMEIIDNLHSDRLDQFLPALKTAKRVIIDSNLPESTLSWLAIQSFNGELIADAVSVAKASRLRPFLPKLDLLKVNRDEATDILGTKGDDKTLAKALVNRGVKRVLFSQGLQGALLVSATDIIDLKSKRVKGVSDTGAGDALLAGFIAAQSLLLTPEHQLEFALGCASFTLTSEHSVNPEISVATIRQLYLPQLPKSAWTGS